MGELDAKRPERSEAICLAFSTGGVDEVGSVLAGGKDAADLIRTAGAVPVNE